MGPLPLHPKLVHLPIALAVLMPLLSGGLLLAWARGWLPKRTWVVACAAQAVLLLSGFAAMRTGEADEDIVERVVPEAVIEAHEESAEAFLFGGGVVLALALAALGLRDSSVSRRVGLATTFGTLVVFALAYRVGEAGGEIVYGHHGAAAFEADSTPPPGWSAQVEEEDD